VAEAGSFRDPAGQVHLVDGRVFRTVMPCAVDDYEFVRSTGLIDKLIERGQLIHESVVDPAELGEAGADTSYVLEHPVLPFISYPYEWSFAELKSAAIHQLDIYLCALEHGVTLSDATAYNIQFRGVEPIFIDSLSFRRYQEGEFWMGHRQFCEQFLNPLLLRAYTGIAHNSWYRGGMEGISAQDLNNVLPFHRKLSFNVLTHIVMQARFQSQSGSQLDAERVVTTRKLALAAFRQMLLGLRKWIKRLEPAGTGKTVWEAYAQDNSYSSDESQLKRKFITLFTQSVTPKILWDVGCNTGEYAKTALDAGADFVVGFDFDQGALDLAFSRATKEGLNFLPLFLDAANPAPSQGWAQRERPGLMQRSNADGVLALALVHHLAIGKNIPLPWVVDWIVSMAPQGIIEFVQKSDPMVQELLRLREDIFDNYSEGEFTRALEEKADIVRTETVSASGRQLFWFRKR
jgi:ribosomal protein L11 methylase PrmA